MRFRVAGLFPWVVLATLLAGVSGCGGDGAGGGRGISDFAAGMDWHPGFVGFYHDPAEGRIYLLLHAGNSDLLYQGSLPRGVGSNDIGLDRGQLGGRAALVRFEPAGDRVLLRKANLRYRADTLNDPERRAVEEAFASAVLWGFPVVARDGDERLVDATEFLLRDSHGVADRLRDSDEGDFAVDASRSAVFMPRSRAFPLNTELEAVVTLTGSDPGPQLRAVAADPQAITVHMHHSFIALPEGNFTPRPFHPESGFFPEVYADYAARLTDPLERRYIRRHRLKKRDPDVPLGDVVEPIVYYLDAGTPEPVRSALLEGASWWSEAFTAAGFRDAFRVELLPDGIDPMDVRYNIIQWVHRSTRGWSYGSSVVDPRSGEILKGVVTLGSLRVRQDLLIARGMTSPFTEGGDDRAAVEMALARIRQLSAHEVGHTLGLAHNFAASTRDRASVMDYPHPQLGLDGEGRVSLEGAYATGIGEWDKRAIRYGYQQFADARDEGPGLAELLEENRREGFEFISDPDSRDIGDLHPRSHLWDNGGDPIAELRRVLTLREVALRRFGASSIPLAAPLSDLQEAIVPVYLFHRYQVEAVAKLVGGVSYRYALRGDDEGPAALAVEAPRQRQAVDALLDTLDPQVLTLSPALLETIPPKAYGYRRHRESAPARTGAQFDPLSLAEASASHSLQALLHPERLARLALQHSLDSEQISVDSLFLSLEERLLVPEYVGMPAGVDRRSVGLLMQHFRQLHGDANAAPEVRAAAQAALLRAQRLFEGRKGASPAYRNLYRYELWLTEQALEGRSGVTETTPMRIPPGSPIGG
ncbi:MAG: zinc-dependent metalloprotease [Pseudomonadota bacterium]